MFRALHHETDQRFFKALFGRAAVFPPDEVQPLYGGGKIAGFRQVMKKPFFQLLLQPCCFLRFV